MKIRLGTSPSITVQVDIPVIMLGPVLVQVPVLALVPVLMPVLVLVVELVTISARNCTSTITADFCLLGPQCQALRCPGLGTFQSQTPYCRDASLQLLQKFRVDTFSLTRLAFVVLPIVILIGLRLCSGRFPRTPLGGSPNV
jgi:hypothetical protein